MHIYAHKYNRMSRLYAQLKALWAGGATVHAVRYSRLSKSVLWEHDDCCARDFYVVLRYFTEDHFGQHVGVASLEFEHEEEVHEFHVHAPVCTGVDPYVRPHLGVYVFNPSVCGESINGPLVIEVLSREGVHAQVIEPDTCPLVYTISDFRSACTELTMRMQDGYDVKVQVHAD